jgi:multimeric flavodoxin WrbA
MDAVIGALRGRGETVEVIGLRDRAIADCRNCGKCADTGLCAVKDDMANLYDKVLSADALVLCSPIYMWHVTAQLKAFLDRLYCVTDRLTGKKFGLVMTAGGDAFDGLQFAVGSLKAFADYSGMSMIETLYRAPAGEHGEWDPEPMKADAEAFCDKLLAKSED